MGNRKTKNLKQGTTSSTTHVHSEERQSSSFIEASSTNIKQMGKDGSSIWCKLYNPESVEQLISFLRNHKQVKDLHIFLSTCSHSGKGSLLSLINTFSNSDCIENLRVLSISGDRIGSEGVILLAESGNFKNLVELEMRNQSICDEGIKSLVMSDIVSKLTKLDLSDNEISDLGIKALLSSNNLTRVVELYLGNNKIGDEGLQYFVEYDDTLNNLTKLDLSGNKVSSEAIKAISTSKTLVNLSYINMSNTEVGFDGIEAIVTSQYVTKLEHIDLGCNAVDLRGSDNVDIRCIALLAKHEYHHNRPLASFNDRIIDRSLQDATVSCNIRQSVYCWLINRHLSDDDMLGEAAATEMLLDIAKDDPSGNSARYIINNYNKLGYSFLINFKDEEGDSLSALYNRSIKMQRFLFKNGMVPQSFHGEDILSEENILLLAKSLSELITSHVEKNIELQGALRDLISGSLDVTKPEGITFNQQIFLSKISRELCLKITGHASHPNYSIYNYDVPPGYSKPMISMKEYRFIIEELKKVKTLQEYAFPTSLMVDISSELAPNTSRKL